MTHNSLRDLEWLRLTGGSPGVEEGKSKQRRPEPRFELHRHHEDWDGAGLLTLGAACEHQRLTEFQAAAVLECATGGDHRTFADKKGCGLTRAQSVIERAATKLKRHFDFNERRTRYWREVLACMKGGKGGHSPRPNVGLLPWVDTENHPNWESYLETLADARNYRTVPMRGEAVVAMEMAASSQAFLQEVAGFI
jgi:hypothetical protein